MTKGGGDADVRLRFVVFAAPVLLLVAAFPSITVPAQSVGHTVSQAAVETASVPAAGHLIAPALASVVAVPAGTAVFVAVDQPIITGVAKLGDTFHVTVTEDVVVGGATVIPKGTPGEGSVTLASKNGSFGKGGILGIALRSLTIGDRQIALDGRYREEARNRDGTTAMTMFMVGILAATIRGEKGLIPAGRVLKARLGEDAALLPVPINEPKPVQADTAPSGLPPEAPRLSDNQSREQPNSNQGRH
jgi:hypothetical protein